MLLQNSRFTQQMNYLKAYIILTFSSDFPVINGYIDSATIASAVLLSIADAEEVPQIIA